MAGWDLKCGSITEYELTDDRIWSLFNYVFSDSSKKRNTYKFGLLKSLLDNAFNGKETIKGIFYSYEQLFGRFAENYWNLVVKYNLRQMRSDAKSIYSRVEIILKDISSEEVVLSSIEFDSLDTERKERAIARVTKECKTCVVGALYTDFDGTIYSFDLKDEGIYLNPCIHEFMLRYKAELEKLNYYSWARFLEQVNDDNALVRVIDKLELSTPRRDNLSIYRELLRKEFEQDTCFYCGKKLGNKIHVDHFIPWSFVKDDKLWNFVLSCETCNTQKSNRIPEERFIVSLENRNKKIQLISDNIVQEDFKGYSDMLLRRMWSYAKISGMKEYSCK